MIPLMEIAISSIAVLLGAAAFLLPVLDGEMRELDQRGKS